MSFQGHVQANQRRTVLSLLSYDADYSLSDNLIRTSFSAVGESISIDNLNTQLHWLTEQGLVTAEKINGYNIVTLTDRGLDVAKGISRTPGIRDLLPSELNKLR